MERPSGRLSSKLALPVDSWLAGGFAPCALHPAADAKPRTPRAKIVILRTVLIVSLLRIRMALASRPSEGGWRKIGGPRVGKKCGRQANSGRCLDGFVSGRGLAGFRPSAPVASSPRFAPAESAQAR